VSRSFPESRYRISRAYILPCLVVSVTLFSLLPLSVNRASALAEVNTRCSELLTTDAAILAIDCPSAPTNVQVLPADQGVEVSWDATAIENSVDDTITNDVNTATSFQVKLSPGDIVVNVAATSHTASITGLMNGKVYEVNVVAINEFGASEIVGPLSVTPTSGREGVVGQLVVQYEDGVDATTSDGVATGSESVDSVELMSSADLGEGLHTVELSESVTEAEAQAIINELESDPRIAWAEVDEIWPPPMCPTPITRPASGISGENLDSPIRFRLQHHRPSRMVRCPGVTGRASRSPSSTPASRLIPIWVNTCFRVTTSYPIAPNCRQLAVQKATRLPLMATTSIPKPLA
jgi:hypothetical protein